MKPIPRETLDCARTWYNTDPEGSRGNTGSLLEETGFFLTITEMKIHYYIAKSLKYLQLLKLVCTLPFQ